MSENANVGRVFNTTGASSTPRLRKITIKNHPVKTVYKPYDMFDPTGLIVEAEYGFGIKHEVTGYTISPMTLTDDDDHVTVTYAEDGRSKSATIPIIVYYLYGFDLVNADSNPETRVSYPNDVDNAEFAPARMNFETDTFSYGGWPSEPGKKFMPRPCMLKFDGTVDYYLDPNDYTKKADGTPSDVADLNYGGNAMMEWKKIYTKRWEENGIYHFRCSNIKMDDDFECWCNYDINDREIEHFYTAIFGGFETNGQLRSISDRFTIYDRSFEDMVAKAKSNGNDIWCTEVLSDRLLEQDLLIMIFRSTNMRTSLGSGRIEYSSSLDPFPYQIKSGTMNTKGLFWGSSDITLGVKVFGMENLWGNVWRMISGWFYKNNHHIVKITQGTKDGSTSTDYNIDGNGYLELPESEMSSRYGFISQMKTESFGRFPINLSGSKNTFESEFVSVEPVFGEIYCATVGGYFDAYQFEMSGAFTTCFYRKDAHYIYIGCAISCKPLAGN